MKDILILYPIIGAVLIFVGIPLVAQLVPPNRWYGWRSRRARESERVWYPLNRLTGLWVIAIGAAMIGASLVAYLTEFDREVGGWTCLGVLLAGTAAMGLHGNFVERRIADIQREKQ